MNPRVYDLSLLAGTASLGGGVFLAYGTAWTMIIVGALVIALTLYGSRLR